MKHFLLLPGIFIHELSHLLMGLFLNAQPVNFSIIPNKATGSAGHVSFKNITFYNALPVGIAPTIIGPGLLYLFWIEYLPIYVYEYGIISQAVFYYMFITILFCCMPSSQDMKVIFKNPLSILLYGVISFIAFEYYFA